MVPVRLKTNIYDKFSCIADKCSITCCQQWKIEVDGDTLNKWSSLETKDEVRCIDSVEQKEGYGVIRLDEEKKCPFLNGKKLCDIVSVYGESMLSKTCTTFPREIHEFEDRAEYSLVSCCPEVVDLLYKQEEVRLEGVGEDFVGDDLFQIRQMLIQIIKNPKWSVSESLLICHHILLLIWENDDTSKEYWSMYEDDVVLEQIAKTIEGLELDVLDSFDERNELFLDLAENYRREGIYTEYIEKIAKLAEAYAEEYEVEQLLEDMEDFTEQIAEYESLFRNYLISDVLNESLIPESDLDSMVMMFQWIGMEYVMILHALFLNFKVCCEDKRRRENRSKQCIPFELVRDCIVIQSRMTGYDQEDIKEYLENSFEDILWEWGYFALLVGM